MTKASVCISYDRQSYSIHSDDIETFPESIAKVLTETLRNNVKPEEVFVVFSSVSTTQKKVCGVSIIINDQLIKRKDLKTIANFMKQIMNTRISAPAIVIAENCNGEKSFSD